MTPCKCTVQHFFYFIFSNHQGQQNYTWVVRCVLSIYTGTSLFIHLQSDWSTSLMLTARDHWIFWPTSSLKWKEELYGKHFFFLGHKYYSNSNWRLSVLTTACPLQISVKTKWVCIDFHWTNALTVGWTQPKSSLGITHTHIYIHTLPPDEEKHKWAKRC